MLQATAVIKLKKLKILQIIEMNGRNWNRSRPPSHRPPLVSQHQAPPAVLSMLHMDADPLPGMPAMPMLMPPDERSAVSWGIAWRLENSASNCPT